VSTTLRSVIERFADCRVLVLGDVMLDEYLTGDCSRISPEAPVPVLAVTSSRAVIGGAANTAANIAALKGGAILVALVGDDHTGRELSAKAAAAGIELVPIRDGRPTVRKVRVVGQHQQLLRLDYEATAAADPAVESQIFEAAREQFARCSVVVMSDYAKGFLTERLCQRIIEAAHAAGREVIVDPRPQHASFYVGCDYLTPNWKESLGLLGRPEVPDAPDAPGGIEEVGRLLAERFGSQVLLTLGARGMRLFGRDGRPRFAVPALAKELFDVSGAGDTVVATFALAKAAGCDDVQAVTLANQAAGIVVAKLGTATVSPSELLRDDERERTVVERHELAALATALRAKGKKIITINGTFDVLHAGHLHILNEARRQGDVLIVGLNSDSSVRANKGPDRPFIGQAERAQMLLALRVVDYVHIFDEAAPMAFLEQLRPDVHVNGSEYSADCIEAPTVRAGGGRVHVVTRLPGLSTSSLVATIERHARATPGS
jgi:D-beta-D-heptose 7-phosphate kinase/D-beta-D-heptose 1-phosphate adenosyltransferase